MSSAMHTNFKRASANLVTGLLLAFALNGWAYAADQAPPPAPASVNGPSEAEKAQSRAIYAAYIGNTLTCWYTPKDTCHLWLYPNGTFDSFGYVDGKKTLPDTDYPPPVGRKKPTGLSWWARGTPGNYELCLLHDMTVLKAPTPAPPANGAPAPAAAAAAAGMPCYRLQNDHKIGDVWEEPDGGGRISRMGVLKGYQ